MGVQQRHSKVDMARALRRSDPPIFDKNISQLFHEYFMSSALLSYEAIL